MPLDNTNLNTLTIDAYTPVTSYQTLCREMLQSAEAANYDMMWYNYSSAQAHGFGISQDVMKILLFLAIEMGGHVGIM